MTCVRFVRVLIICFTFFYDCPRLLSLFKLLESFIHNIFPELDVFTKEWWFMVCLVYMAFL